ncbi:MAG: Uncharacterised protein [SAR116 cluster bacterium]|nr:MAG: Uncharacterised protein [SAR116 cluster bacterium]
MDNKLVKSGGGGNGDVGGIKACAGSDNDFTLTQVFPRGTIIAALFQYRPDTNLFAIFGQLTEFMHCDRITASRHDRAGKNANGSPLWHRRGKGVAGRGASGNGKLMVRMACQKCRINGIAVDRCIVGGRQVGGCHKITRQHPSGGLFQRDCFISTGDSGKAYQEPVNRLRWRNAAPIEDCAVAHDAAAPDC